MSRPRPRNLSRLPRHPQLRTRTGWRSPAACHPPSPRPCRDPHPPLSCRPWWAPQAAFSACPLPMSSARLHCLPACSAGSRRSRPHPTLLQAATGHQRHRNYGCSLIRRLHGAPALRSRQGLRRPMQHLRCEVRSCPNIPPLERFSISTAGKPLRELSHRSCHHCARCNLPGACCSQTAWSLCDLILMHMTLQ